MSIKFFYNFCLKEDDTVTLDGDILSGVRRSYFSGFERIKDRITINSDAESTVYDYSIEKDKPARWLVKSADGKVLQETVSSDGGKYYIYCYCDQSLYKRLLFSRLHTLLRIEYFDLPTGIPVTTLEPRKAQTGLCILYTSRLLTQPLVIYPEPDIADPRVREKLADFDDYTVIASTNDGLIRFLSDDQLAAYRALAEQIEQELAQEKEESFVSEGTPLGERLKAKDFNVKRNLAAALDITRAEEFSFGVPEEVEEDIAEPEPVRVISADDVAPDTDVADDAVPEADEVAAEIPDTCADVTDPSDETTPDETAVTEELVADTVDIEHEAVQPEDAESAPEDASSDSGAAKPDKLIMADGAIYSYYGELDENGNRSGYGRTLTDEGRTAYEGHYRHDKRSGKGSYFYKDGSLCYTGEWIENARHGVGVGVSSQDGSIHVGRWSLNKPIGSGVRLSADGEIKFVCKELSDGTTVLMNYMPDDTVVIAKYDENGKKLGERVMSLSDYLQ